VSVFLPALKVSNVVKAEELPASSYTMKTVSKINNNKLVDGAKYGEGKFYLKTTYAFPDNVTLNNGDFMVYHVPNEFKIEVDSTTDLKAPNGDTIATLTTEKATNTAKITVTNEEYFKKFNENKQIVASFTVVWADHVEKNKEYEINIPGAGVYHLTRIVPDDDPTGYTKWGVQDADDPNYVNWRIRINRYVKPVTGVKIEDTIALHLYNHIIHKSPRLKRIVIDFSYVERLGDGASIGHSRTEEYAVHGKRLVKLKHDTE